MSKYVVSGYIGFDNFGDEAIAKVLTSYLKDLGAENVTLISSNPQKTSKLYGVETCSMLNFFGPIIQSDILISGGGSLLQDVTSLKSLIYYLSIILFALICRKKVIIFAQGFTPFRTKLGEFLTINLLKHCEKITVRDTFSQNLLKKYGVNATLVADPVFNLKSNFKTEKNGVGIQLRDFPTLTNVFINNLADSIFKNFHDKEIKLISLQDSIDLKPLTNLYNILKNKGLNVSIKKSLNINNAIMELTSVEYLIAMRFHACLVGINNGIKTIGINYDVKVETLSKEMGFPIIELNQNNIDEIINKIEKLNILNYNLPKQSIIL